MYRKLFTTALVISLALSTALAQQTTIAPSVERLRAHIEYLASDKLEGRRTGSEGAKPPLNTSRANLLVSVCAAASVTTRLACRSWKPTRRVVTCNTFRSLPASS